MRRSTTADANVVDTDSVRFTCKIRYFKAIEQERFEGKGEGAPTIANLKRLEGRVLELLLRLQQLEDLAGASQALFRLADAELEPVHRRVDEHQCTRGHQA